MVPTDLADLLCFFKGNINSFRSSNENLDERNLSILNDIESYIESKFSEIRSRPPTIHDGVLTPNTDDVVEKDSNAGSLESQVNASGEVRRVRKNRIESERRNDTCNERANEPRVAGTARGPSQRRVPESPKIRAFGRVAASRVSCELDDGILHFFPSREQWADFAELLRVIKSSEAAESGVCKVTVPCAGAFQKEGSSFPPGSAYRTQARENGTIAIDLTPGDVAAPSSLLVGGAVDWTAQQAVDMFERRIKQRSGLKNVRYCSDVDARAPAERGRLGLPLDSPIWPLSGDGLARTRARVPGLHFPYAYKANASFGAIFAAHKEDYDLFSVNYLYQHRKVWIVIPRSAAGVLESMFRESASAVDLGLCAQFVRHHASYVPLEVLDRWKVPYRIVQQNAGEAVLVFPGAYHQGFSVGETVAEAVNYADDDWDPASYAVCRSDACPPGFVDRDSMAIRNPDEDQESADGREPDGGKETGEQEATDGGPIPDGGSEWTERSSKGRGRGVAKRKATGEPPVTNKRSRNDAREADPDEVLASKEDGRQHMLKVLEEVTSRPTIDGVAAYCSAVDLLRKNNAEYDDARILTLMRLFFATASPDAVCQLRDACQIIRRGSFEVTDPANNIFGTVEALDRLDASGHAVSIAKRFYLVALSARRFELRAELVKTSGAYSTENTGDVIRCRNDALALTCLMAEAYPKLKPTRTRKTQGKDEYGMKHKLLKERLVSGQKWSKLSQAFTPGILALVPTRGEYHVSNREYVRSSWLVCLADRDQFREAVLGRHHRPRRSAGEPPG